MVWDRIEHLSSTCPVEEFKSGLCSVDEWLKNKAHSAQSAGRVAVHTALIGENILVGFFALKQIVVSLEGESKTVMRMAEQGSGGCATGTLLAQMGVDLRYQRNGAGTSLVREAMKAAVRSYCNSPFTLMVVDAATDELVAYYEKFGFKSQATQPRRLFMKMSAVCRIVSQL